MAKVMTRKKVRADFLRTSRLSVNLMNNDLIVQCMNVNRMMSSSSVNFEYIVMYTCPETDIVTTYTMGKFLKEKVLPDACEVIKNNVMIPEEWFAKYFGKGTLPNGTEVERASTPDDYCRACAMIINHKVNRERMNAVIERARNKEEQLAAMDQVKKQTYFTDAAKCSEIIGQLAPNAPLNTTTNIKDVLLKTKCKKDYLLHLMMIQDNVDLDANKKHIPQKKGTKKAVVDNLLKNNRTCSLPHPDWNSCHIPTLWPQWEPAGIKTNFSNAVGCDLKLLKIEPEIKNTLIFSVQSENLIRVNGCRLTLVKEFLHISGMVWFIIEIPVSTRSH